MAPSATGPRNPALAGRRHRTRVPVSHPDTSWPALDLFAEVLDVLAEGGMRVSLV
ncbi:hypothetical protein ACR6C2_09905 [Streptomyces sp. INA 01156]